MLAKSAISAARKRALVDAHPHGQDLLRQLERLYPDPRSELQFSSAFELLVAVLLSAQCTDKKVNQVTPHLFARYPTPQALAVASVLELEGILRPINYYRTKSKHLLALAQLIVQEHSGEVPRTRAALLSLPGVGNKTASVVLGELGVEPTLPVDTHVFRVARRLGLSTGKDVQAVEQDLCAQFKSQVWRNLHHWLIFHGRRVCKARAPHCSSCALALACPSRGRC